MTEFDYYIRQGEPSQREKAEAWAVAIGLQDVDGLKKRYEHIDWKAVSVQVMKSSEKSSEKILRMMSEQPTITTALIAQQIGISTRAVDKQIAKLKASGRLQRIGADKGGHWEVINK